MKEDMGKIQKDNKQGVVCIRCVRVLCRPSSRYRKAGTGLYTKKRDFLLHYSGAKKSRFFFCTTTQGGHAMKKYWKYSKEQLRDVFSTTEQGLSEKQVQKIRETCGENILEEGKRPGLLRVFLSQFADLLIVILLIAALISMFSGNAESTIVIAVVLVMNAVLGFDRHHAFLYRDDYPYGKTGAVFSWHTDRTQSFPGPEREQFHPCRGACGHLPVQQ